MLKWMFFFVLGRVNASLPRSPAGAEGASLVRTHRQMQVPWNAETVQMIHLERFGTHLRYHRSLRICRKLNARPKNSNITFRTMPTGTVGQFTPLPFHVVNADSYGSSQWLCEKTWSYRNASRNIFFFGELSDPGGKRGTSELEGNFGGDFGNFGRRWGREGRWKRKVKILKFFRRGERGTGRMMFEITGKWK